MKDLRPGVALLMVLVLGVTAALAEPGSGKKAKEPDVVAADALTGAATAENAHTQTGGGHDKTKPDRGNDHASTDTTSATESTVATTADATLTTTTTTSGSGTVQLECKFSHRANDDPIVYPRQPGVSHSHEFFGNRTTNASSTYASMIAGPTTCGLPGDTGAYWVPSLVDGNGTRIPAIRAVIYYRDRPQEWKPVTPFPPDFRMIGGPLRSGWNCDGTSLSQTVRIDCSADPSHQYVRVKVFFPMCAAVDAQGRVLTDSPDHRSHMAFELSNKLGCPASHPVKLPAVNLNVRYAVTNCIAAQCRLVSDAPSGVPGGSVHADYWNTWNQSALVNMVNTGLNS